MAPNPDLDEIERRVMHAADLLLAHDGYLLTCDLNERSITHKFAEHYFRIHTWFDESKQITADFRHRALRHHAEGIFMAERIFGSTMALSTGRVVPVRWIGEQHVLEDLGFIPSFADWVRAVRPEPWMGRSQQLDQNGDSGLSSPRK
jgi:Domain of unknown function (DUF6915)